MGTKTNILEGLKTKSPKASDSSMTPPKGSVKEGATRSTTAPTPKSLGPRS